MAVGGSRSVAAALRRVEQEAEAVMAARCEEMELGYFHVDTAPLPPSSYSEVLPPLLPFHTSLASRILTHLRVSP